MKDKPEFGAYAFRLAAVGRARYVTDRNWHPPNTEAWQAFEKAHRNTPTWVVEAVLDILRPGRLTKANPPAPTP